MKYHFLLCISALGIFVSVSTGCQKSLTAETVTAPQVIAEHDTLKLEALPNSPLDGAKPKLTISSPRNNAIVDKELWFQASLSDWPLEPEPGRHVHVIIDDLPYIAVRDLSEPIELLSLIQQELGTDLATGTHLLRVFASRGQHESVKTAGASAFRIFHLGRRTSPLPIDLSQPMIAYSRPKGCNPVDKPVLLDFYLFNWDARAHREYKVQYAIDGKLNGTLSNWTTYQIHGLEVGAHTIHLALLDSNGEAIKVNFSNTTRDIEVKDSCPP